MAHKYSLKTRSIPHLLAASLCAFMRACRWQERKKAEQVKARRAAALSLLLEPPSPGTFTPLSNDSAKNSGILGTGAY